MASRRQQVVADWNRAQARDLRELPHATRLVRPGSFGTYAERTKGSAPEAPTLDDGALYTGEYREEVDGNELAVPLTSKRPYVLLASLRRPWPYVGFAIDTSDVPSVSQVTAGLVVLMRSGHARLLNSVVAGAAFVPQIVVTGTAAPFPWVTMTGIYAGARVAVYATQSQGEDEDELVNLKANLWGYNAPGFGP